MKNSPVKPWYKRWKPWAYVFAFMFVVGLILPDQSPEPVADAEPAAEPAAKAPSAKAEPVAKEAVEPETEPSEAQPDKETEPKETLADAVNEYLGDRRIHGQSVKDGYYTVETDFGDFIGPEFCEEESVDLAELISEHPGYAATGAKGVKVVYISGVTDAYGNSADETVMYIEYSNETMARINFDNFDVKNVVAVADDYYRMASFK